MSGIKLLPTETFCPVEEEKSWMIFDPARSKLVAKRLEEQDSLGTTNELFSITLKTIIGFMQAFDCGGNTRQLWRVGEARIKRLLFTNWPRSGVH